MTSGERDPAQEQIALPGVISARPKRRSRASKTSAIAEHDPVALVQLETPLPHLDRYFSYAVPANLAERAQPGVRIKARLAGRDHDGFVIARTDRSDFSGTLQPLRTVVGDESVLTPEILSLCRAVADSYAGTLSDVLRLAIPPRHATAERELPTAASSAPPLASDPSPVATAPPAQSTGNELVWHNYPAGPALLRHIADGSAPQASWLAAPAIGEQDWPYAFAELARHSLGLGRGALLIVPDGRDIERVSAALRARLGPDAFVELRADLGPAARYTAFLKILRGHVKVVVGSRSAAFAPVHDLGVLACWDDGDDTFDEPRAPYPHVRDVLRIRAEQQQAALIFGGHSRSIQVQQWVTEGSVRTVAAAGVVRPRVEVAGDESDIARSGPAARAHLPSRAWQRAKTALQDGPVLIQVPRRGYLPALSCSRCRAPARCTVCHGPLAFPDADSAPTCRWCGTVAAHFSCPNCGGTHVRSSVVGAGRTAEELGRAFPGVPVIRSAAPRVLAEVDDRPALVVATPGAEPVAAGGYRCVLLLDAWALLERPSLDAGAEALRRWMDAAVLLRPGTGSVVLCGAPGHDTVPAVESLVRWAPEWFADRELTERDELGLPPARWFAELTGQRADLLAATARDLPEGVQALGPLPTRAPSRDLHRAGASDTGAATAPGAAPDLFNPAGESAPAPNERMLLLADFGAAEAATRWLTALRASRSMRRDLGPIGVRVRPAEPDI